MNLNIRANILPRHTAALELVSALFCTGLPALTLLGAVSGADLSGGKLLGMGLMLAIGLVHLGSILFGQAFHSMRVFVLPLSAGVWADLVMVGWISPGAIVLFPIAAPMALGLGWAFILHFAIKSPGMEGIA